jgi:eukaryotic-like serine/threonine-protein kinase
MSRLSLFPSLRSPPERAAGAAVASRAAAGPLPPGTCFSGLRIERLLARGAAGCLYLALEESSQTPLAVKVLALAGPGATDSGLTREAFEREARTAIGLRHPGIVVVHGVATLPGLGCIVMELLAGTDLSRYTRPGRLLPEPLAIEIAASVAEALGHAHRQGVVHRDVKPANVMFDPASGGVKLTDFGLARASDAEATRSGLLLGSPAYMAPELLGGTRADAASDLYALGAMLFELLTGRLPFEGETMGALLRAMATQAPQTVRALRPDLPPAQASAIDAVLASVITRTPGERQRDGAAWAAALRRLRQSVF